MEIKKYLPSLEVASFISKFILVILGIFFIKLWDSLPPDPKNMIEVEGEVVVIEPSYAHIKLNEKVVRVEISAYAIVGGKKSNLKIAST